MRVKIAYAKFAFAKLNLWKIFNSPPHQRDWSQVALDSEWDDRWKSTPS